MRTESAIRETMDIAGALGAALIDRETGVPIGTVGGGRQLDLAAAAALTTGVFRAKLRTLDSLRASDEIDELVITMGRQYHLVRPLKRPGASGGVLLYLVLDRARSNLALARHTLKRIGDDLAAVRQPFGQDLSSD